MYSSIHTNIKHWNSAPRILLPYKKKNNKLNLYSTQHLDENNKILLIIRYRRENNNMNWLLQLDYLWRSIFIIHQMQFSSVKGILYDPFSDNNTNKMCRVERKKRNVLFVPYKQSSIEKNRKKENAKTLPVSMYTHTKFHNHINGCSNVLCTQ